jgi:hypothetical protein
MDFKNTSLDEAKRAEYHTPEFVKKQMLVKSQMQADLYKAIDELTSIVDPISDRIKRIREKINKSIFEEEKQIYQEGIEKYEELSSLSNKVSEVFVMLLDIYTYGAFGMLAKDEWDWRAFARHFYTILYEHSNTVNRQLNEIIRILKTTIGKSYDLTSLIGSKKEFSKFIFDNSEFAKQIRVNVDAHFDGNFAERLQIIRNLSYSNFVALYYDYNSKMHAFLLELKPALAKLRLLADSIYYFAVIR